MQKSKLKLDESIITAEKAVNKARRPVIQEVEMIIIWPQEGLIDSAPDGKRGNKRGGRIPTQLGTSSF